MISRREDEELTCELAGEEAEEHAEQHQHLHLTLLTKDGREETCERDGISRDTEKNRPENINCSEVRPDVYLRRSEASFRAESC